MSQRRRRLPLILSVAAAMTIAMTPSLAHAAPPEADIRGAGSVNAVPDSYIVVLKGDGKTATVAGVDTLARDLTAKFTGTLRHTYHSALRGFSVKMTERQARRLAAHPDVAYVEADRLRTVAGTQPNPPSWGLDRTDQRNLPLDSSYTYPNAASNVHAYIVDTGILTTHNDFGGRAVHGRDTVDNDNDATDCQGHGTHVAGTVGGNAYGIAKNVTLVAVRVLNCSGQGTDAGVIAGIDWVTANAVKPAVANMSLGGGASASLDAAVQNSIDSGITYAIAAGNGDFFGNPQDACGTSPARVADAITVGATDNTDRRASFSNYGTCLDLFAPGVSITSAWKDSNTSTNTISGTSMAAPHVAGAAALVASAHPNWTPSQIRDQLVTDATSGAVTDPKTGSPNKLLYVTGDTTPPPADDFSISVSPASGSVNPGASLSATVATTTTAGSAQTVNLSASGLPSGATASFSPASVTSGGSSTMTIATTASTPGGTYPVTITGTGSAATHSTTFNLTVTGDAGGCTGTNGQDFAIPTFGTVDSPITISGCGRAPSATSKVEVHIVHPYRGDVRIRLIAPDGTSYLLKDINGWDSADDVHETFTVDLSGEAADGTWKLRVDDWWPYSDHGHLDSWTITL